MTRVTSSIANYVFAEVFQVDTTGRPDVIPLGTDMIALYIELDPNKPKADVRAITIENARQLHSDLTQILGKLDE